MLTLLAVAATLVGDAYPAPQDTLVTPPVLTNVAQQSGTVEVRLVAAPARLSLVPGTTSDVYAHNGRIPGPTLEVREGDRMIVHFRNELPESTAVHWHGLHVPFASDGSPFHSVPPGDQQDYVFTVQRGTAGTYWYHPHQHHRTRDQVVKGLYGAIIVRAPNDPLPDLPEKLLILADNRFLPGGSLDIPDPHSAQDRSTGRTDARVTCCSSTARSCRRSAFGAARCSGGAS